jgi:hypothetical protein
MLDRIVEVFCEVDDFCQAFLPQWEASLLDTGGTVRWLRLSEQNFQRISGAPAGFKLPRSAEAG